MNNVKKTASILGLASALVALMVPSTADAASVTCASAFGQYSTADWLDVSAVRINARWEGGTPTQNFSMDDTYDLSSWAIGSAGAALRSSFSAARNSSSAFSGFFTTVHPDRPNQDIDVWEFWVFDTGVVWLRSVTWGGGWQQLPNRACFDAYTNGDGYTQTVVTGRKDNTNHTDEFWTIGVQGWDFI